MRLFRCPTRNFAPAAEKPLARADAHKKTPFIPYSCPFCGAPIELGDSHCAYCKMPLFHDPTAPMTGTCAMCGKPAPAGESYCLDCREVLHDMEHSDVEDAGSQTHPCADCGKTVWIGAEYCPDCKEKRRRAEAKAKKARRVCWHCGSETETRNRVLCLLPPNPSVFPEPCFCRLVLLPKILERHRFCHSLAFDSLFDCSFFCEGIPQCADSQGTKYGISANDCNDWQPYI